MRLALAHQAAASPNSHNAAPSPRRLDATAVSSPGGFRTPALRRAQPSCQGRIQNPSQQRTLIGCRRADVGGWARLRTEVDPEGIVYDFEVLATDRPGWP